MDAPPPPSSVGDDRASSASAGAVKRRRISRGSSVFVNGSHSGMQGEEAVVLSLTQLIQARQWDVALERLVQSENDNSSNEKDDIETQT